MEMDDVESGQVRGQRATHRPGGEPYLRGLQPEETNGHAVSQDLPWRGFRLAKVRGIDCDLMAAARHASRHLEPGLRGTAAFRRQIADDMENAQIKTPRHGLNALRIAGVPLEAASC